MKNITFFVFCILSHEIALCQNMILHDPVTNKVFSTSKYSEVKGSPYLTDKWVEGTATIQQGTYKKLHLKLDLYNNTLLFNKDDEAYEFEGNVISFVLMPKVSDSSSYQYYKKGFTANGLRTDQYVQVLVEGPVSLYRSDIKLMTELSEVNRGIVKSFSTSTRYFVIKDNGVQLIKLTKKEVLQLLYDKEEKVLAYAEAHDLSFKKEADIALIIKHYNSISL
jgi:hypothetical protein